MKHGIRENGKLLPALEVIEQEKAQPREKFSSYSRHKNDYPTYSTSQMGEARTVRPNERASTTNNVTLQDQQASYVTEMTTQFIPRELPPPDDEDFEYIDE